MTFVIDDFVYLLQRMIGIAKGDFTYRYKYYFIFRYP